VRESLSLISSTVFKTSRAGDSLAEFNDKKGAIAKTHTSVKSYFLSIKGTEKTRQLTLKINLKRMFGN
jgi:hypothetical protein